VEFSEILYEVDGAVATLTMNRPDRLNAFTINMQREMNAAFDLADADDNVRVVIVTGARELRRRLDRGEGVRPHLSP
jgi:enoyl-CoA hydratase/carnithine racemase